MGDLLVGAEDSSAQNNTFRMNLTIRRPMPLEDQAALTALRDILALSHIPHEDREHRSEGNIQLYIDQDEENAPWASLEIERGDTRVEGALFAFLRLAQPDGTRVHYETGRPQMKSWTFKTGVINDSALLAEILAETEKACASRDDDFFGGVDLDLHWYSKKEVAVAEHAQSAAEPSPAAEDR